MKRNLLKICAITGIALLLIIGGIGCSQKKAEVSEEKTEMEAPEAAETMEEAPAEGEMEAGTDEGEKVSEEAPEAESTEKTEEGAEH
ncbi:hypothetical protein ACFLQJ_02010 [Calditrichota bacterium]